MMQNRAVQLAALAVATAGCFRVTVGAESQAPKPATLLTDASVVAPDSAMPPAPALFDGTKHKVVLGIERRCSSSGPGDGGCEGPFDVVVEGDVATDGARFVIRESQALAPDPCIGCIAPMGLLGEHFFPRTAERYPTAVVSEHAVGFRGAPRPSNLYLSTDNASLPAGAPRGETFSLIVPGAEGPESSCGAPPGTSLLHIRGGVLAALVTDNANQRVSLADYCSDTVRPNPSGVSYGPNPMLALGAGPAGVDPMWLDTSGAIMRGSNNAATRLYKTAAGTEVTGFDVPPDSLAQDAPLLVSAVNAATGGHSVTQVPRSILEDGVATNAPLLLTEDKLSAGARTWMSTPVVIAPCVSRAAGGGGAARATSCGFVFRRVSPNVDLPAQWQLDRYEWNGGTGATGSPVFDRTMNVVSGLPLAINRPGDPVPATSTRTWRAQVAANEHIVAVRVDYIDQYIGKAAGEPARFYRQGLLILDHAGRLLAHRYDQPPD